MLQIRAGGIEAGDHIVEAALHALELRLCLGDSLRGVGALVHAEDGALDLATADLRWRALTDRVAVRAVALHRLVVQRAVAVAAIVDAEVAHIRHGAAELEADLGAHGLLVLLGDGVGIVHDGDVGDVPEGVAVLAVTELVAGLQEEILHALHLVEAILVDRRVRRELVDPSARDLTLRLLLGEQACPVLGGAVLLVREHRHSLHVFMGELRLEVAWRHCRRRRGREGEAEHEQTTRHPGRVR
mmetsp:Transcript_941/g.2388  ORF Transcript_941/g.2388 Transcript_941/m.2388 type:complete len:243 (+) Transcript_941:801-1529(+)